MTFTLRITCDNAAFDPDPGIELARILRKLAQRLENGSDNGELFDINGNKVGQFNLGGR